MYIRTLHVFVCRYTYVYTYVYICRYVYTCIYIRTYTYMYMHINMLYVALYYFAWADQRVQQLYKYHMFEVRRYVRSYRAVVG